ncbi:glycine betaine ABC transporter substrate-binding protein [Methanolobus bombayensis]|uniref:glycine betaine ABC transporter substrate-binding protein n=1 Tax=Methanolobus bombayensis TaxID=38023 RepID=UPI001AE6D8EF|nr:glycine betaine ABC transporter substrate-binding protein [Methanolobus bombayensis]MBP1910437.1 glycine betaine/proline transport system substrate-binding protein [Methanolobus bombayensis]
MKSQIKVLSVILVLAMLVMVSGCADQGTTDTGNEEDTVTKEATIGYVLWDGEIASTNVMKLVLEQAGYDVEIIAVDAGALYQGLADSQFDFTTSAWLPQTQRNYWEQYGDDIDSVAVNLEDCRIGLVVPTYVTIDSIEELNDNKEQFNGEIIGIDPGAGIMSTTETAIENYSLDYELVSSSSAGMTAELKSSIEDDDWVVVTLWSPHWAFNSFDLKYLEDPNGVYGEADHVETLARVGLEEDDPELYGIISRFQWTHDDIQSVMSNLEAGMSEEEAAQEWVDANPEKVNEWLGTEE